MAETPPLDEITNIPKKILTEEFIEDAIDVMTGRDGMDPVTAFNVLYPDLLDSASSVIPAGADATGRTITRIEEVMSLEATAQQVAQKLHISLEKARKLVGLSPQDDTP